MFPHLASALHDTIVVRSSFSATIGQSHLMNLYTSPKRSAEKNGINKVLQSHERRQEFTMPEVRVSKCHEESQFRTRQYKRLKRGKQKSSKCSMLNARTRQNREGKKMLLMRV
jgi:hypothetical protein